MLIGVISEILLVAVISSVFFGIINSLDNRIQVAGCGLLGCASYEYLFEPLFFYLGLILLVASAVGFLSVLRLSRKTFVPPSETA